MFKTTYRLEFSFKSSKTFPFKAIGEDGGLPRLAIFSNVGNPSSSSKPDTADEELCGVELERLRGVDSILDGVSTVKLVPDFDRRLLGNKLSVVVEQVKNCKPSSGMSTHIRSWTNFS